MSEREHESAPRGRHAPPLEVRQDRQRRRLYAAAGAVFSRVGYAETTAEGIAREAGMSKATFYEHFDNKEDCIVALHDDATSAVLEAMRRTGADYTGDDAAGRVRAVIHTFLEVLAAFLPACRVRDRRRGGGARVPPDPPGGAGGRARPRAGGGAARARPDAHLDRGRRMSLAALEAAVHECRRCPRLVAWREQVAVEKRAAFRDETYWGRPVGGFGDPRARVMLLGLAPAAHGANRTGRMFTGDRSGDFLYAARHGAEVEAGGVKLLGCFHPSQQNTFTGKLTPAMIDAVLARAQVASARSTSSA